MAGRRWLRGDGIVWPVVTVALWCAALATKEIGAMFPFVLLFYDICVVRPPADERRRRVRTVHAPLIGAAVAAGLVRVAILARIEAPQAVVHWPFALFSLAVVRPYLLPPTYPIAPALFSPAP